MEAKNQVKSYLERLLNTKDEQSHENHLRHIKEVDDLREKHQKDVDLAKNSLADLYEKKVEYLQDAKDESEGKLLRLERLFSEKEGQYDDLMTEYRKIEKLSDAELQQTRLDVRLKSDELMRITHLYEDNMLLVKELKVENESYR